jgi:hypothetical protein
MDITSKEVYDAERFANVTQTKVDALLSAIEVVAARKANTLTTYAKA